jgi:hypothetical protein
MLTSASLAGFLAALASWLYVLYCWSLRGIRWSRPLPSRLSPPPLPLDVLNEFAQLDDQVGKHDSAQAEGNRESLNWCNVILQCLHALSHPPRGHKDDGDDCALDVEAYSSGRVYLFDRYFRAECRELVWDLMRLPVAGCVLVGGRLRDYYFGAHFPVFSNIKLLRSTVRPGTICLSADVDYDGDLQFWLQWDTVFSSPSSSRDEAAKMVVDMTVGWKHLGGRFWLVVDQQSQSQVQGGDVLYVGFRQFQGQIECHLRIDGWFQSSLLDRFLSKLLVPLAFRSRFVLPHGLKGKWLRGGPQQPPYPWECDEQQPDLYRTWTP